MQMQVRIYYYFTQVCLEKTHTSEYVELIQEEWKVLSLFPYPGLPDSTLQIPLNFSLPQKTLLLFIWIPLLP